MVVAVKVAGSKGQLLPWLLASASLYIDIRQTDFYFFGSQNDVTGIYIWSFQTLLQQLLNILYAIVLHAPNMNYLKQEVMLFFSCVGQN